MTFTNSGIDPGEEPTTDVAVDTVGGIEFQRVKLADPAEGSTDPVGTSVNPHRVTLEHTATNTNPIRTIEKKASTVSREEYKNATGSNSIVLAANGNRLDGWVKSKESNTENVFVSLSDTATTTKPTELSPGQTLRLSCYTGAVAAITAGGTVTLEVVEL